MDVSVVVLAAGKGSRMKSALPKVLHPLAGVPLAEHVVTGAKALSDQIVMVVGHGAEKVREHFDSVSGVSFCEQLEQLGTGHAVTQALPLLSSTGTVLVLYGDVPLTKPETLNALISVVNDTTMGLLTVSVIDPTGYGRIVRDEHGNVARIVEHKDASEAELEITEVNSGIMALPANCLHEWLPKLSNNNAQGEYYLTDLIAMAVDQNVLVKTVNPSSEEETLGVNNRIQLSYLERWHQQQIAHELMMQGVTLIDPARLDVRGSLKVGSDSLIDVNCIFEGSVTLASNVSIGANCIIKNSNIAEGAVIEPNSIIDGASIGERAIVGPFARIRPGTTMSDGAKVGNFVEVKKSALGAGSKVNHLSYIGDSQIGEQANIGAGTITCNYDGVNKYPTTIGDNAFVGSNSTLVAPVEISKGAFIGAGSVITKTAPEDQLTLARSRQTTVSKWQKPIKK